MKRIPCANCKQVDEIEYSNGGILCCGIVKGNAPKKDVIRLCEFPPEGLSRAEDMHIVEALDKAQVLTRAVSYYLEDVDLDKLEEIRSGKL